jgi:two-component system, OmpR family, alkaline phosphatase synthesis response regulator PhoP
MTEQRSRILVVDDDIDILDLLRYNLEKEGFRVKTVEDSTYTVRVAEKFQPDLVILDIMMPEISGFELCAQLRNNPSFEDTYIFFLTARSGSTFQETALKLGGDDYIEKLTGLRLLLYKVNSVLKRKYVIKKRFWELNVGDLFIDRNTTSVFFKNERVVVSEGEFEILFFLAQNNNRKLTLENLIYNIWGTELHPFHNTVKQYIENLQRKIYPNIIKVTRNNEYRLAL